jgi:hypothetical protein
MMMREVRTIRQKIDKRTSEALSQPLEMRKYVEAVGNSIHYFPLSLKGSGKHPLPHIIHLRRFEQLPIRRVRNALFPPYDSSLLVEG